MSAWELTALGLLVALMPCGVLCARAPTMDRLVALQLATTVTTLLLLVLARVYQRDIYFDVALVLAALAFPGGLVFVRLLERRA
ncbi:monovalent cation/H+ antiporter complex subunit F [Archangium sp.]|uniref:monovalent cation/H+ antiporter complex subunit F n=1 Tax=Archangium sp. TaxID=1872627 RepID=UPI00389A1F7F